MRFLVVEDDETHATLVERALRGKDREVVRVKTVDEAENLALGGSFDLIVLDYELPDGTGLDVLDALQEHKVPTPVLFLTGQGSEDIAYKAMTRGAVDYLVKGTDVTGRLEQRVEEVLQGWSGVGELVSLEEGADPARAPKAPSRPDREPQQSAKGLQRELDDLVEPPIEGGLVVSGKGQTLAHILPDWVDAPELGSVLRRIHEAVGQLGELEDLRPRRYAMVAQTPKTLIAMAVAPGPLLVALLFSPETGSIIGLRRAQQAARRIWEAG